MNAGTIRERGGYAERTIRYVIERRLVPGIDSVGTGNRRDYTAKQAFLIALACELREEGFRGPIVKSVVEMFDADREWNNDNEITITFGKLGAVKLAISPILIRRKLKIAR